MRARLPFVVASSDQGTFIVNRLDYHQDQDLQGTFGIGIELLDTANYEPMERDAISKLLDLRHQVHGDGVVALDVGANIGTHTVAWSRHMTDWGVVFAFEAQEWVFYALAGNIAINNCLNTRAFHVAVGTHEGSIQVPSLPPNVPANFGGLELDRKSLLDKHQHIGTEVDRDHTIPVRLLSLDSLNLSRVDLMKIDVEGMESNVIDGAKETLLRCKPILFIEWVKSDQQVLADQLRTLGYDSVSVFGMNMIAIHPDDECRKHITFN